MNQWGIMADFLVCKIGVALAALALLGAALGMSSSFERTAEREDLAMIADTIAGAIQTTERLLGDIRLKRELPIRTQAEVTIIGNHSGGVQAVHIIVWTRERVERTLMLTTKVNGGDFTLSRESPSAIRLSKTIEIQLELI